MTYTFDPIQTLAGIGALLLIFGVVPFTPVAVGILLLLSMSRWEMSWGAR